jgi:hypothetical protein
MIAQFFYIFQWMIATLPTNKNSYKKILTGRRNPGFDNSIGGSLWEPCTQYTYSCYCCTAASPPFPPSASSCEYYTHMTPSPFWVVWLSIISYNNRCLLLQGKKKNQKSGKHQLCHYLCNGHVALWLQTRTYFKIK